MKVYAGEKVLITGAAGFIGAHLTEALLKQGAYVIGVDNFLLGKKERIATFTIQKNYQFYECDVADLESLQHIVENHKPNIVFHMAANSDIQKSAVVPNVDYANTFLTTYTVLEVMRRCHIKRIFFASTSAVYGEKMGHLLTEKEGDLRPVSYYGAGKLASEAFLSAYTYMNDLHTTVFRFPNVIGANLTHGVIFDFINKLKCNPNELEILGDGSQSKPYIHVSDLIEAMLKVTAEDEEGMNIYNVGVEGRTSVTEIADMVCERLDLHDVMYRYTGGNRGWKGDVPTFEYDLTKIHRKGWKANYNSNEAVKATLREIEV